MSQHCRARPLEELKSKSVKVPCWFGIQNNPGNLLMNLPQKQAALVLPLVDCHFQEQDSHLEGSKTMEQIKAVLAFSCEHITITTKS